VDPGAFAAALRPDTLIACVMYANNEIGTVQSIAELAALTKARGALFHTDAVAAVGWLPLDTTALGVDLLSLSAHKFYGPRGAGVLFAREGTAVSPLIFGGGQEFGRRSGTEDVVAAAGLAEALEIAESERTSASQRVGELRDALERAVLKNAAGARINGATAPRLPDISSVTFPGTDAAALLMLLDLQGVAASAGSACTSGSLEPSHVIAALGPGYDGATIRLSLGRSTGSGNRGIRPQRGCDVEMPRSGHIHQNHFAQGRIGVTSSDLGPLILDVLAGVGILLAGIGILLGMRALAGTLGRVNETLDRVDRQVENLSQPVGATLSHVDGIANTADQTLARLSGVVGSLEDVAGSVAQTAKLTKDALAPAIVNAGATIAGVSSGLRRLVTGKNASDTSPQE
jgi:uncharacterized protein YoxC